MIYTVVLGLIFVILITLWFKKQDMLTKLTICFTVATMLVCVLASHIVLILVDQISYTFNGYDISYLMILFSYIGLTLIIQPSVRALTKGMLETEKKTVTKLDDLVRALHQLQGNKQPKMCAACGEHEALGGNMVGQVMIDGKLTHCECNDQALCLECNIELCATNDLLSEAMKDQHKVQRSGSFEMGIPPEQITKTLREYIEEEELEVDRAKLKKIVERSCQ